MTRVSPLSPSIGLLLCVAVANAPAEAALPQDKIDAVEKLLIAKMAADEIPGLSVAIVQDGKLAWANGYGLSDVENSVRATSTTAYRTASIGKSMTATAIMQLVEHGKIDLAEPIQNYCPSFPAKRWPVTTRHLLTHTSGIRHYGGSRNEQELFNTRHYDSVIEALEIFRDDPLEFEPGTRFQYTSFGYNVLGCVVEGASGERFLEYMRSHVFEPAAMQATRDDDPAAIIARRANGYIHTEKGELRNSRRVDMSSKMPAGGFITTAEDLARFAAALIDHRLVRGETLEAMRTAPTLRNGELTTYGLGWRVSDPEDLWYGEREMLHGGGTPQVSGILYLLPERRFAVALLMNLEAVSDRTELAATIAKEVLNLGRADATN